MCTAYVEGYGMIGERTDQTERTQAPVQTGLGRPEAKDRELQEVGSGRVRKANRNLSSRNSRKR